MRTIGITMMSVGLAGDRGWWLPVREEILEARSSVETIGQDCAGPCTYEDVSTIAVDRRRRQPGGRASRSGDGVRAFSEEPARRFVDTSRLDAPPPAGEPPADGAQLRLDAGGGAALGGPGAERRIR